MKQFFTIFSLILFSHSFAQLNIEEVGYLDISGMHSTGTNDIWGYTDEEGNEYALIGTEDGFSIVDISTPTDPEEVFWTSGLNSVWRDVKVYGDYAYVTTEALQGLMIVDLSGLPGDTDLPTSIYTGPEDAGWLSAHNLYEKDGYLYIFGANRGMGGVIILDVMTDPLNPEEVGTFDNWYVHDGYVHNDTGYFGHIYEGFFSIVDLTDKDSPVLLGTAITPSIFTHNIWVSDDGNYAFTTDEVSDGYIGSFDISDPTDIRYLDKIQSSPGNDIVPHNSFVHGNFLYTSYYADGVVIHDITHPHNMIEVGNYDTSPFATPDFKGCWGVYPYFESGYIVASDREEGLFVLTFNEEQGAYLEGNITEAGTGFALNDVTVTIDGTAVTDESNIFGDYATGTVDDGVANVTYFKVAYEPQTFPIDFISGEIAIQDVVLEKLPEFDVNIRVVDATTLDNIVDAEVIVKHTYTNVHETTDVFGSVNVPLYYEDNYEIIAGKWGYETNCYVDTMITSETGEIIIYLDEAIYDDFTFDYGWTPTGFAANGMWEQGVPLGVAGPEGDVENPYFDVSFDCGDQAYLTGNLGTESNEDQVDNGTTLLMSPTFSLSGYSDPYINLALWYYNAGETAPNDTLEIHILNGGGSVVLMAKIHAGNFPMSTWEGISLRVSDYIAPSSTMRIRLKIGDQLDSDHITEVGVDAFSVTDYSISSAPEEEKTGISVYPNPFANTVNLTGIESGWVTIMDISGRFIKEIPVDKTLDLSDLEKGTYLLVISDINRVPVEVIKQVKS